VAKPIHFKNLTFALSIAKSLEGALAVWQRAAEFSDCG
jgi:hypothetical protein